ncbi:MAG: hypothetical protein OEO79_03370 [Gemmatimonadota bacterium]|nr:hypothetical protein [Gemmatimonadota bacterium]MDH3422158.1 hypothetical protein [Gemmatimonadota bacterium]
MGLRPVPLGVGLALGLFAAPLAGQADSTMAQDGLYDRPFIGSLSNTSIGGYIEGNTNYFVEDGLSEGFSMELRRFNVFLFSQISQRVRFISELEFEHGTEEIALETALIDFEVSPALILRAGIILPPLGFFNQNHDSPRWDFVERPLVATDVIPSTLSEVGGGAYGRIVLGDLLLSYDAYLTNGLGDGIVGNELGRTDVPSGKREEQFAGDNNGSPAVSARVALRKPGFGEVGVSHYGGYYNAYGLEGVLVDERRWLAISALDVGASVGRAEVRAELAYASIDVPPSLVELFGDTQWGAHVDVVVPLWRPQIAGYPTAVVSAALRVERVDYNVGSFSSTGESIRDDVTAVVPGISFRPSAGTVFRANYRYHWTRDFPGNPTNRMAGFQLGFATYF